MEPMRHTVELSTEQLCDVIQALGERAKLYGDAAKKGGHGAPVRAAIAQRSNVLQKALSAQLHEDVIKHAG